MSLSTFEILLQQNLNADVVQYILDMAVADIKTEVQQLLEKYKKLRQTILIHETVVHDRVESNGKLSRIADLFNMRRTDHLYPLRKNILNLQKVIDSTTDFDTLNPAFIAFKTDMVRLSDDEQAFHLQYLNLVEHYYASI